MLIAQGLGYGNYSLGAYLAGNANVEKLQQALQGLAQVANWTAVNPGSPTGVVNDQTLRALAAGIGAILKEAGIDGLTNTAITYALGAAFTSSTLKADAVGLIAQYAPKLTMGVAALTARYMQQGAPPTGPSRPPLISRTSITDHLAPPTAIGVVLFPHGSIATRTATGYRVAAPLAAAPLAGGLSGPLGEATHRELAPTTRTPMISPTMAVPLVSVADFDEKTKKPWYKNWKTFAIVGGVVVAGGVAWWILR